MPLKILHTAIGQSFIYKYINFIIIEKPTLKCQWLWLNSLTKSTSAWIPRNMANNDQQGLTKIQGSPPKVSPQQLRLTKVPTRVDNYVCIICFRGTAWGTFRTFNTSTDGFKGKLPIDTQVFNPRIKVLTPFVSLKPIPGLIGIKNYNNHYITN